MGITQCNGRHDVEGYNYNGSSSEALTAAHVAACHEVTFEGAVLRLRERNGYDDSDFLADVWDEEAQRIRTVQYATTRGWTYHNGASIDASHEVIEKAVGWQTAVRFEEWQEKHAKTARKGYTARATVKGEAVEGVIAWIGEKRQYSQWAARYADPVARYGIRVEGRKGLVFANADDEGFSFDAEPVSAEDMIEWRAQCEANVRAEFSQAQALADQRDPRPDPTAPGTIVDSQEADEDGFRLYAVSEPFCEEAWARGVAEAVVDQGAAGYVITGVRVDGGEVPAREVSVFRVLQRVVLWADGDGSRIMHDGAGAVRLVSAAGGVLVLRPVRPEEAPQGPQEDAERPGAAEVCTHPSQCVTRPVGAVRATKTATGEGGVVGVYCSVHLSHPAETFPDGYTYEYLTVDGRGPVEAVEALQGTEGDPVWVARRDEALEALRGLMDGGAGRYRRTVLIEGTDARGMSDTMPTAVARVYLAEEVADGGEVGRRGMAGGVLLVRANGARLVLAPARGVVPLGG